ncbi:hypothetical protein niasHT_013711 [Heterodera trifolii]|uniref:CCR4-NOT transcription complex subunit 1 n=1 Tax=Heterodera trifolii TaxID=157864 RepID=A0ABD2LD97_9BILA
MDLIGGGGGEPSINELIRRVQEIGGMFTSSVDSCQQSIRTMTGGTPLEARTVANLITAMVAAAESPFSAQKSNWELMLSGVGSGAAAIPSFEGATFVAAVRAEAPSLDWHEVFAGLDNPIFQIRTKTGLQLLTLILLSGIAPNPFPVGLLYRPWSVNKPGQLSWLTQIIHHPDVFSVTDYPHHPVNLSCLKVFPDERNVSVWKCLDLVEILFRLGEVPALDTHVIGLFRSPGPMLLCPDLLFLGTVQINMPLTQLRVYVLKCLIATLLSGHANTVAVLQFALSSEKNKMQMHEILRNSMVGYYSQNLEDQGRLTRILEIAHELKILGELLNMTQFAFVIDLATLAARRDYLKLDKFIGDKLSEHGERFAQDMCHYLRRRCPVLTTINPLANDTFHSMFSTLQQRAASWPVITADLNQLIAQISRGKATPASAQQFGGVGTAGAGTGVNPFVPLKGPGEPRMFGAASNPAASGLANAFTMFRQQHADQQQQMLRSLRSTPGAAEFHDFRLTSQIPPSPSSQQQAEFGEDLASAVFSEDIQEEANSYFQQIYAPNGRMSVNDFIAKLKGFRHSGNIKERELLLCVVKNLFDEYRFFREYPERELRTTAEVYGGIIREEIILNIQFATAIRRVIESLNDEPGSMLWTFGIVALSACRACLYKYPKVCHMIINTNSYGRFPPGLKDYVSAGALGQLPMNHSAAHDVGLFASNQQPQPFFPPATGEFSVPIVPMAKMSMPGLGAAAANMRFAAPTGGTSTGNSILNVTNVDTLISATEREGTQVKQPPQQVLEKVAFTCNNLCTNNLLDKTQELTQLIRENGDEFLEWFAQYLVMKRVTVEHNYQQLYNSFLVLINNTALDNYVKKETYRNINILLKSDKQQSVSNFGDRQLLKNLGHWLGIITIGRDRPILNKDLDMKYLLFEAFYKGQQELLYIVPFVVKCITASAKSQLFGPHCGWVYAILKVLAEIHNEPDLKLNLRFEIEVLCKELNVDLRSIEVGSYLKEQRRLPKLVPPSKLGTTAASPTLAQCQLPPIQPPHIGAGISSHSTADYTPTDMANILTEMSISRKYSPASYTPGGSQQQVSSLTTHQTLPTFNYADIALQSGILQIIVIPPHLMLFQDFSLDSNEQNLRRGAHQMMRSMTAAIASITCREPLSQQMNSILKMYLTDAMGNVLPGSDQAKMVEEAATAVTDTNINIATNFVVKNACEKAVADIEKRLESEYVSRKTASDDRPFQVDADMAEMSEKVPEMIRLKEGPISEAMLKVYDDFSSKICGFKPLAPEDRFIEFTKPGLMNTPTAASSRTPTNVLAPPFIPSSQMSMTDVRTPTTTLHGVIPSHHPPPIGGHSAAPIMSAERMALPPGIFSEGRGAFCPAPGSELGVRTEDQILQSKVENILREWISICYTPMAQKDPQHALAYIVQMMHDNGVLATDEMITKFFRLCAEICFDVSYRLLKNESSGQSTVVRQRCYYTLDAFTKLTCLMVKYSDGQHHSTKVNLLKKILAILTTALNNDHEQQKFAFNGLPFHRILVIMFNELTSSDPVLDSIQLNILESFGQVLFLLQPRRVPGFAYHWLDIIGHRNFIGRLLSESQDLARTSAMYTQLLLCHLKFLAPFLRNVQLPKPIAYIYKGTLRVLLVLLHDFPEILCEYYYILCDVIPANCVQLRNLVLSAYPCDMRLPDPFTETMARIECLPEMSNHPKMHREMTNVVPSELRKRIDAYLETRSVVYLSDLPSMLLSHPPAHINNNTNQSQKSQQQDVPSSSSSSSASHQSPPNNSSNNNGGGGVSSFTTTTTKYAISVVNAVVMYVGVRAIDSIHGKGQRVSMETIAHSPFMDIFQNLAVSLCNEGRYLLFNAIANQLRYPNSHTHYFSCTLLYLFLGANSKHIQEQITRILFERLVALRPHPWGLLITFIELIRNQRYGFWKHEFVYCATEIERLFLSVANSCSVSGPESHHSNGI